MISSLKTLMVDNPDMFGAAESVTAKRLLAVESSRLAVTSLASRANRRPITAADLHNKIAPYYKGQPLKVVLRLVFDGRIPEDATLMLFSPYALEANATPHDIRPTNRLARWLQRIKLLFGRYIPADPRPPQLDTQAIAEYMAMPADMISGVAADATLQDVEAINELEGAENHKTSLCTEDALTTKNPEETDKSSTHSGESAVGCQASCLVINPRRGISSIKATTPATYQYRILRPSQKTALLEFDLDSARLLPHQVRQPVFCVTLQYPTGNYERYGFTLPQACFNKMVSLRCRPSILTIDSTGQESNTVSVGTVIFERSDRRDIKITPHDPSHHPQWLRINKLSDNTIEVCFDKKTFKNMYPEGQVQDHQILKFTDKLSRQQLWTYLPLKLNPLFAKQE